MMPAIMFDDILPLKSYAYPTIKEVVEGLSADVARSNGGKQLSFEKMMREFGDRTLQGWYQLGLEWNGNDERNIPNLLAALHRAKPPTSVPPSSIVRQTGDIVVSPSDLRGAGGYGRFGNGGMKTAIAVSSESPYNTNVDAYDPSAKRTEDFENKYNLRQVQGEMSKLSKNEKWSLVIGKERVLFDSEAEAVEAAKKRIKECILYHHIQEVDSDGIVQHSEDRCVGKIGYIDNNTKERALFTYRGGVFASADRKSKNKLKKGGKYYI